MRRVYITLAGVETDISNGQPFEVISLDPLGASNAKRITERSPLQHGDSDIDHYLEPRILTLILQMRPNVTFSYETGRKLLNTLFRATNTPITLAIEFDNGELYHIDTQSIGGIKNPYTLETTLYIREAIQLRAANPTFYDPVMKLQSFGLQGGGQAFMIPMSVPTFFGSNILNQAISVEYAGTFREYPIILINGPIVDPKITNVSTGYSIDLTGYTVAAGDVLTIDLRFGRKTIYNNNNPSDSRLYALQPSSNIAMFSLEPDPYVLAGDNILKATGTGLTNQTQIYLQYYHRFDGI